jgi:VCBS repeat-containing protein
MSFENPKSAARANRRHVLKSVGIFALATAGFSMSHARAAAVTMAWNANPETDITGYQLSYGTSPGVHPSVVNPGTNTTASVPGLTAGMTYYFVVSATNQAGLQSPLSSEISYQVPAAPVNHAPVATSKSVTTAKGTPLPIALGGTDVDGNTLTYAVVSGPANGILSGTAPNLTYSPSAAFTGSDSFTFLANDGSLNSNVATVNLSVNALVAGTFANGSFESGYAGWAVTGSAFIESAASPYTATDGVKLASLNGNSTSDSTPNAVLSQIFATTAGTTYTLAFDMGVIGSASGEQKLQVTVDGAGNVLSQIASKTKAAGGTTQWSANSYTFVASSPATTLTFRDISAVTDGIDTLLDNVRVTAALPAANTAPVAVADSYSTTAGTALVVAAAGVLANDTDAQANPLTAALDAAPGHGSLTLNPNGGFTYTPAAGYAGPDSFTYHANDGTANSATATASITVTPANSLPLPWNVNQLGTGNIVGSASSSAGVYTIAGSGALAGKVDAANFGWQTISGDGNITARISNLNNTGTATRVGVMIRESLAANSRQVFIGVNNTGTFQWLRRTTTGGSISTTTSSVLATSNQWVRLTRAGNTLTSYKSANGTTWTRIGAVTVTLPANCYIGLSVSSGSNTVLNTSQFSDVSITP